MKTIIYDPQQTNMERLFCDPGVKGDDKNIWHAIQCHFRKIGFELYTPSTYHGRLEDVSWIIFQNMPSDLEPTSLRRGFKRHIKSFTSNRTFYQKCRRAGLTNKLAVILYEPEVVAKFNYNKNLHARFSVIFTWNQDLIDLGRPYAEFVYPQADYSPLKQTIPFENRKLICNFSANKTSSHPDELYSARIKTIKFLEGKCLNDFDHYGNKWSNEYKSWRGAIDDKQLVMSGYRFNLCYENARGFRGYVTEKIFDAFHAGCVPIYLGAPDIRERIPSEAFVDRRNFSSDAELLDFLFQLKKHPEWQAFIEAGQEFLRSEAYKKYTSAGVFKILRTGLFGLN